GCHDHIVFFSDRGVAYSLRAYQLPEGSRTSQGIPIVQMLPIPKEEKITSVISVEAFTDDEYLVMLTQNGYIKKTALSAFSNIRANGLIAISLEEGDQLRWVRLARTSDSVLIGSHQGMTIHFRADDDQLRPLGRPTRGVKAMNLRDGDDLISMDILPAQVTHAVEAAEAAGVDEDSDEAAANSLGPWVLLITAGGMGKRVPVSLFRLQNRAGMGLRALKFRLDDDSLVAVLVANEDEELMLVTNRGIIIRQRVNDISIQSRSAQGVRLQRLDDEDAIAAVALVPSELSEDEDDEDADSEVEIVDEVVVPDADVTTVDAQTVETDTAEDE
ncbi:MAG: DNA gyrase C-terminal beta-propeller domain-containing protein, partial [Cyanobacteria bacterium P01_C01_bin.120]